MSNVNNKDADQPAEQAGLSLKWSQSPKTGFLVTWLIWYTPVPTIKSAFLKFPQAYMYTEVWENFLKSKISTLQLASVAEQAGLSLTWS